MDPTLIKWLTIHFPSEVVTPILLLLMFVLSLWPKIWSIILNQREWNKVVFWERQRLELMKLRCEVEALKKTNGLEEVIDYPASPEFERLLNLKVRKTLQRDFPTLSKGKSITMTILTVALFVSSILYMIRYFI